MSLTGMKTLAFLLFELSPFVLFEVDFVPLYNSNTLWNILMVHVLR